MREPKLSTVLLVRCAELPQRLPDGPEQLCALPEVRSAFVNIYRRPPSLEEQRRVHLSPDREWLIVTMPDEEKTMLTTTDVAAQLGYSDDQIRRMCESGRFDGDAARGIPGAYRACVGAQWRIPRDAVECFLEGVRPKVVRR